MLPLRPASASVVDLDRSAAHGVVWTLGSAEPGQEPSEWDEIPGPMTVAAAWRALGHLDVDDASTVQRLDSRDHWFRAQLPAGFGPVDAQSTIAFEFDGLATVVELWCNGSHLLTSTSMFLPVRVDATDPWRYGNANVIELRCRSLTSFLDARKWPRPKWRTRLVPEQRLRNVRTTLLGRIPSWSPPTPPVGPWRASRVVLGSATPTVESVRSSIRVVESPDDGPVEIGAVEVLVSGTSPGTTGQLFFDGADAGVLTSSSHDGNLLTVAASIERPQRWWPWTHGTPRRYDVALELSHEDGSRRTIELGAVGFRTVEADRSSDGFRLLVNGEFVFARGGVWMPIDPTSARSTEVELRRRLELARAAGFNMIRLSGTTWYEEPVFHRLCDELGILVWHDLALANMDPPDTAELLAQLEAEIAVQLPHGPSLAVVCGGSEIEQQATMNGLAREVCAALATCTVIPEWVHAARPDVAYVSSTPTGGHLPFAVNAGVGHYFGVGAYLRPLIDARHADVRFAAESLAFANPGRPEAVRAFLRDGEVAPTHPRWKARVPRDRNVGWDFEDVRDHYVREVFDVDPASVRYGDPDRYLALGRAAVAETMSRTFGEFRRSQERCGGALVWCFNDLWAGAGWGIVDSAGRAKSSVGALRAVLAPLGVFATDEGVNGLDIWVANDSMTPFEGTIELTQYRHGSVVVGSGSSVVHVAPRSVARFPADTVIGRFSDPTFAYRFGPAAHDGTSVRLRDSAGAVVGRQWFAHYANGLRLDELGLRASSRWNADVLDVVVETDRVAEYVTIEASQDVESADHVHVEPGHPLTISLRYFGPVPKRGYVRALNGIDEVSFPIPAAPSQDR